VPCASVERIAHEVWSWIHHFSSTNGCELWLLPCTSVVGCLEPQRRWLWDGTEWSHSEYRAELAASGHA